MQQHEPKMRAIIGMVVEYGLTVVFASNYIGDLIEAGALDGREREALEEQGELLSDLIEWESGDAHASVQEVLLEYDRGTESLSLSAMGKVKFRAWTRVIGFEQAELSDLTRIVLQFIREIVPAISDFSEEDLFASLHAHWQLASSLQ